MPCQEKVLPSRAARGSINWREEQRSGRRRRFEVIGRGGNGCRGAS